jgi:hypothetical protein
MLLLTTRTIPLLPQWCVGLEDETEPEDVLLHRRLYDVRLVCVMPRDRGFSLAIGMPYPFHRIGVFAESWYYTNELAVWDAFHQWNPTSQKEPMGWTRHVASGRYRLGGDPTMQYIQAYGSIDEQILHAVTCTKHSEEQMIATRQIPMDYATIFPLGTQCFVTYTESDRCPHTPKCQRPYTTFHYLGRSVVLPMDEIMNFYPEQVVARLTSEE